MIGKIIKKRLFYGSQSVDIENMTNIWEESSDVTQYMEFEIEGTHLLTNEDTSIHQQKIDGNIMDKPSPKESRDAPLALLVDHSYALPYKYLNLSSSTVVQPAANVDGFGWQELNNEAETDDSHEDCQNLSNEEPIERVVVVAPDTPNVLPHGKLEQSMDLGKR